MLPESAVVSPQADQPTRRALLRGVAAAGAAAVCGAALSSCGNGGGTASDDTGEVKKTPEDSGHGGSGASGFTASTKEIPPGSGKVFDSQKVVVTQPETGQFKAFTAVCTHQACIVAEVADGTINCACHGSKFSITDGSVRNGPATKPLAEKQISVHGDEMTIS